MHEHARLTVLTDPSLKRAFDKLCESQESTSSQVLRGLIADFLRKHGVAWQPTSARDQQRRR